MRVYTLFAHGIIQIILTIASTTNGIATLAKLSQLENISSFYILLARIILQIVLAIAVVTHGLVMSAKLDDLENHTTSTDITHLADIRNILETIIAYVQNCTSYHL